MFFLGFFVFELIFFCYSGRLISTQESDDNVDKDTTNKKQKRQRKLTPHFGMQQRGKKKGEKKLDCLCCYNAGDFATTEHIEANELTDKDVWGSLEEMELQEDLEIDQEEEEEFVPSTFDDSGKWQVGVGRFCMIFILFFSTGYMDPAVLEQDLAQDITVDVPSKERVAVK